MADQPHDKSGGEFAPPPDFIPNTPIPAWVTFHPELSPQARATCDFLYGHVNLNDGTFLVTPSHASIAKYLGLKKADGARRYVTELKEAGIVSSVVMFWDRKARQRTTQRIRADGVKNDQTSNSTQLRWTPPRGRLHPGPMNSGEWHHPTKIHERIATEKARLQAQQTPPPPHEGEGNDQEKGRFSQVKTHPHTQGGASPSHEGEPPPCEGDEENQGENTKPSQSARATKRGSEKLGVVGSNRSKKGANKSKERIESVGADLLRSLGVAEHALPNNAPIVDTALEQLGEKSVWSTLSDGLDETTNPAGVVLRTRVPQLQRMLSSQRSGAADVPPWCGKCGDPSDPRRERKCTRNPRMRVLPNGELCGCATAEPNAA